MRLKIRKVLLLFGGVLIFFLLFKILKSQNSQKAEKNTSSGDDIVLERDLKDVSQDDLHKASRNEVVRSLIKKYHIDWGSKLTISPWDTAAKWVSAKHVLPEFTPELGEYMYNIRGFNYRKT